MSDKEAQEAYGEKLYIASLAVVTEKDKIRLVHDATNKVQVNNRIRVRDQARSPVPVRCVHFYENGRNGEVERKCLL